MPEVTLLYAAFAAVALWLLGELLLQRRAPLHWRALALVGFLVLVGGVAQGSLPMIGAGVVAFGAGQALATRAVKHSEGAAYWSLVDPESVPVVGRLFVGGEPSAPAPQGRSRGPRPEPVGTTDPEPVPTAEPVSQADAMEATAVFQADEYAVEGDSVYYASAAEPEQQAPYYAYTAEHQETHQGSYPQEQYQESYAQQPYQEYPQYQQYTEQYPQQYAQQYAEPQQQYAAYEQQPDYGQQYPSEYAAYGSYDAGTSAPAQPQQGHDGYGGYDYGQTPYYTQDPYHAPQG